MSKYQVWPINPLLSFLSKCKCTPLIFESKSELNECLKITPNGKLRQFTPYFVSFTLFSELTFHVLFNFESMKLNLTQKYFGIALLLSLLICITLNFPNILSLIFFDDYEDGRKMMHFNIIRVFVEIFTTFLVAFLVFAISFFTVKPFERHHKLKLSQVLITIAIAIACAFFVVLIFNSFKPEFGSDYRFRRHHDDELFLKNFFSSALSLASVFIMRLIFQKQSYELENEKLRTESLQSQFESLKNQVSPHFLFNSLTAMKTLIRESPDLAGKYVDHLSLVLRYTLQSNEKQLVTLREEMEFTDSYLFLIKMRYDTNLVIQTEINKNQTNLMLPPLTLQTLLENAIKHNEISKRNPLTILIKTGNDDTVIVSNRIQEKLTREDGTGIGLSNLAKQYLLLGKRPIQIIQENNEFRVEVPLIRP